MWYYVYLYYKTEIYHSIHRPWAYWETTCCLLLMMRKTHVLYWNHHEISLMIQSCHGHTLVFGEILWRFIYLIVSLCNMSNLQIIYSIIHIYIREVWYISNDIYWKRIQLPPFGAQAHLQAPQWQGEPRSDWGCTNLPWGVLGFSAPVFLDNHEPTNWSCSLV